MGCNDAGWFAGLLICNGLRWRATRDLHVPVHAVAYVGQSGAAREISILDELPRTTPAKSAAAICRHGSAAMGIKVRLRHPRPLPRAAVELVHALNAFRPLGRKGYVTFLAFWFGWRTTEVPHLFMTASMIDAVRRARRGDFAGRRGKAALALTAASWAILAVIYRRGMASRPQLLDPLREELGVEYTDSLARRGGPARGAPPSCAAATSRRTPLCATDHTAGPTWPTYGAALTCRAMGKRLWWCKSQVAGG